MTDAWNVLVAEDELEAAKLLKLQLATQGHRARIAHDGQEAILFTGSRVPELIIMDIMMPTLDGLETSRYFKNKYVETEMPILILTARTDADTLAESAAIGCDDFMAKPYDVDEFQQSVQMLIDMGKAENRHAELRKKRLKKKKFKPSDEEELEETIEKICELRSTISSRLIDRGFSQLVPRHLDRIVGLRADYPTLAELRARLG